MYDHTRLQYASIVQKKKHIFRLTIAGLNADCLSYIDLSKYLQYIDWLIGLVVMTFPLQLRLLER